MRLVEQILRFEEEERLEPYQDSKGFWTIGVGHVIDRRVGGMLPQWVRSFPITQFESSAMLRDDISVAEFDVAIRILGPRPSADLGEVRCAVLASMAFQLGITKLLRFEKMISALRDGNWDLVAKEALDSKWARLDSPERAKRHARALRTGEWKT